MQKVANRRRPKFTTQQQQVEGWALDGRREEPFSV